MAPDNNAQSRPIEITMTDLEAGQERGRHSGYRPSHSQGDDVHAAGTPGGGMAAGGLGGTNAGNGDPDNADLEDAFGSGVHDTAGEEANDNDEIA